MSVLSNTGIRAGASAGGGGDYQIEKSLRFNDDDSAYLNMTPSSDGNQTTFTLSWWMKRSNHVTNQRIFGLSGTNQFSVMLDSDGKLYVYCHLSDGVLCQRKSSARLLDSSAWYSCSLSFDTTQDTDSDRLKMYVNGVDITPDSTGDWPGEDTTVYWGDSSLVHYIGRYESGYYMEGYLADIHFIDGTALDADSFGETNATTGQWVPKRYSGSYGTNGFYLKFDNTSDLGEDSSGNDNDWTANNFSTTAGAGNDSLTDTPTTFDDEGNGTGNYATLNPLYPGASTLSNGNLDASGTGDLPTIIPGSGQWYYEIDGTGYDWDGTVADFTDAAGSYNFGQRPFEGTVTTGYKALNTFNLDDPTIEDPSAHFDVGLDAGADILSTALGLTDGADFVWIKDRANTDDHILFNRINDSGMDGTPHMRSNEDDDEDDCGTYSAPSGNSVAWVWNAGSANTSVSAGDFNSTAYNKSSTWSGSNSASTGPVKTQSGSYHSGGYDGKWLFDGRSNYMVLNPGSNPGNWVEWTPADSAAADGGAEENFTFTDTVEVELYDATNNVNVTLTYSDDTTTTTTVSSTGWTTIATGGGVLKKLKAQSVSGSGFTYWSGVRIDGKQLIDDDQSVEPDVPAIDSTYRANTDAGFSIVSYTGTGSAETVAHGLNAAPQLILLKDRDAEAKWKVLHHKANDGADAYYQNVFHLDTAEALTGTGNNYPWNATAPTSTVFSVNEGGAEAARSGSTSGTDYVAYCWSEVEGYSKFGAWTGTQDIDGPFVYCGFKPAYILLKCISHAEEWIILDNKRDTYNEVEKGIYGSLPNAEDSGGFVDTDFLSNGFKLRANGSIINGPSKSYICAAFAETPFKYSNAR